MSDRIDILSGVLQGLHIIPLLFIIFINDNGLSIEISEFLLFAEDLRIFKVKFAYRCSPEVFDYDWSLKNNLHLNIQKL